MGGLDNVSEQLTEQMQAEVKAMNHVGTSLLRLNKAGGERVLTWAESLIDAHHDKLNAPDSLDPRLTSFTFMRDADGLMSEIGPLALIVRAALAASMKAWQDVAAEVGLEAPGLVAILEGATRKPDLDVVKKLAPALFLPVAFIAIVAGYKREDLIGLV